MVKRSLCGAVLFVLSLTCAVGQEKQAPPFDPATIVYKGTDAKGRLTFLAETRKELTGKRFSFMGTVQGSTYRDDSIRWDFPTFQGKTLDKNGFEIKYSVLATFELPAKKELHTQGQQVVIEGAVKDIQDFQPGNSIKTDVRLTLTDCKVLSVQGKGKPAKSR